MDEDCYRARAENEEVMRIEIKKVIRLMRKILKVKNKSETLQRELDEGCKEGSKGAAAVHKIDKEIIKSKRLRK